MPLPGRQHRERTAVAVVVLVVAALAAAGGLWPRPAYHSGGASAGNASAIVVVDSGLDVDSAVGLDVGSAAAAAVSADAAVAACCLDRRFPPCVSGVSVRR